MTRKIGTLAHFENFLKKGKSPWEYPRLYDVSHELVDELQEKRLCRMKKEAGRGLRNPFLPLLDFGKIDDDSFPVPGFETSEIKFHNNKK